jgi:hypothetical protein
MWNPFRRKEPAPASPPPAASAAPLPSAGAEPDRYQGRPLLILLENYVLAAIGELPAERSSGVGEMVRRMWGGGDDWMRTLRDQLGISASMDDDLRGLWTRNQEIARENGAELHSVQFAKMVADQNFAHLL